MASFLHLSLSLLLLLLPLAATQSLNPAESNSVYSILDSINPTLQWRTLFPEDPCSAPHGVVCDFFQDINDTIVVHVTELSLGFVSDYSPNPICTPTSTLSPDFLSPLSHLRKLFFYRCFTSAPLSLPSFSLLPSLEEIVFIENPSLFGSLEGKFDNLTSLRRLVVTGTGVSGKLPEQIGGLESLEELSLSRNRLSGEVPSGFSRLKNLKLLDLSYNRFIGDLPGSIGGLGEILKIDVSYNRFSGKIPENLKNLKKIEFLDLGYNRFGNFGVPLFLSEMRSLREVYLSGNLLGGHIPEIWENLGGILGISLSNTGLIGNIPKSMGVFLVNACYIGLNNNSLTGRVPDEFGSMRSVLELNLENNMLAGRVPFSTRFARKLGEKLKLQGNLELCVDKGLLFDDLRGSLGNLKVCSESSSFSSSMVLSVGGSFVVEGSRLLFLFGFLIMFI